MVENEELKIAIKEKIEELTFSHYEGNVEGLIICVVGKGSLKIHSAYDNNSHALLNLCMDMAKHELLNTAYKAATTQGNQSKGN